MMSQYRTYNIPLEFVSACRLARPFIFFRETLALRSGGLRHVNTLGNNKGGEL